MIVDGDEVGIWKKAVLATFEVLSRNSIGEAEENHKKHLGRR
jgi:hypothetical protein